VTATEKDSSRLWGGDLGAVLDRAVAATGGWGSFAPSARAAALRAVADALDAASPELVPIASEESHLPAARLSGEVVRTTSQLRLFAEVLEDGAYLEAVIDHPDPEWPSGPRPDVRRILVPLGPALVFAASNFPFAFSVAGGDTASALGAGCPVVVKAHPGHPRLSARTGAIVEAALRAAGAPDGTFAVVFGEDAGSAAVQDARIRVGAFTGSLGAGRALFDLATSRPDPIPFYGELGSLNPVFVTTAAADARMTDIAAGFVGSFTFGAGQLCTKPGLLFVPAGAYAQRPHRAGLPRRARRPAGPSGGTYRRRGGWRVLARADAAGDDGEDAPRRTGGPARRVLRADIGGGDLRGLRRAPRRRRCLRGPADSHDPR